MTGQGKFFDRAYDLENAEQTRRLYDEWAASYDEELRAAGYASPARTAAAMAEAVADKAAPLLAYEERIGALVEADSVEVVSDAYGDHLPQIGLKAKIYVLRKR